MGKKSDTAPCLDDRCDVRVIHLDRVARAKAETIAEKEMLRLAMTFKIMGDPTRLKIILALRGGEMCVCDIAAFIGRSESAVSHQLRRLREFSLVRSRRDGQVLYYSLDDAHVLDLVTVGLDHIEEDGRLRKSKSQRSKSRRGSEPRHRG